MQKWNLSQTGKATDTKTDTQPYVFLTGAAGGLGKAFAAECAARGWNLFLTDLRDSALRSLAEGLIRAYDIHVVWQVADLTDANSRNSLYEYAKQCGLPFRMLINVAGLDYEGAFSERCPDEIMTLLRLNIEANLETTYAVLPLRDRTQPFHIINVASLAAFYPMPLKAMYASSKRFILQFSLALREELRGDGVTVTALCPAGMPTTPFCIRAIEAQGLAGILTTKNVGYVAAGTIERALKGRAVYIPGTLNRTLQLCGSLLPPTVIARLVGNRWHAAHNKPVTI